MKVVEKIIKWFKLPEMTKIENLDEPSTTLLHRQIIQRKRFLKALYIDFYKEIKKLLKNNLQGLIVEIGSGGGFIKDIIPNVITSDIFDLPGIDKNFSALNIPYEDNSVSAFLMINVLHHLSNPYLFFKEANRCLRIGGKIVMIEPNNSIWSRFIYKNFHHELFDPFGEWKVEGNGRLTSANGAIPWIVFFRDREKFEKEFPTLKIIRLFPHTPFRYLISGGVSMRQLLPSFSYHLIKGFEFLLSPFNKYLGMFITIELEKVYFNEIHEI